MKEKLRRFFEGRYGNDQFSRFLSFAALVPLLLSMFLTGAARGIPSSILWGLALAMLIYGIYRSLSKDIYKRQAENRKYLAVEGKVKGWFRNEKQRFKDRKNYRYFHCPKCRATLRVPRHKGKVKITCKKCGNIFEGKT